MMHGTPATPVVLSITIVDWLMRLDFAAFFTMFVVGLYLLNELATLLAEGDCGRPLQLLGAMTGLAFLEAIEGLYLGINRAAILAGQGDVAVWFFSGVGRLLVPAAGAIAGLALCYWLDRGRYWLFVPVLVVTAVILTWSTPVLWILLRLYDEIQWMHRFFV